jgi:hypothetical protein
MDVLIIFLSFLFFTVLVLGLKNKSRDSFFLKYYGLTHHKNKYLIQNIINYLFCLVILVMTYLIYFYHIHNVWITFIPLFVHTITYVLKKHIE